MLPLAAEVCWIKSVSLDTDGEEVVGDDVLELVCVRSVGDSYCDTQKRGTLIDHRRLAMGRPVNVDKPNERRLILERTRQGTNNGYGCILSVSQSDA